VDTTAINHSLGTWSPSRNPRQGSLQDKEERRLTRLSDVVHLTVYQFLLYFPKVGSYYLHAVLVTARLIDSKCLNRSL
jgi:hypothetical protein